jgi:hypothetical protein
MVMMMMMMMMMIMWRVRVMEKRVRNRCDTRCK